MKVRFLTLLFSLLVALPLQAAIDTYEFDTQTERDRYRKLIEELRCPKCQNQNIADSDAPISMDLRDETFRLMTEEGLSDEQIVDFLVERYGDFVRYKPPRDNRTLVLWYGPFALLGFGMLMLVVIVVRRRGGTQGDKAESRLSSEDQQRLEELLKQSRESADK